MFFLPKFRREEVKGNNLIQTPIVILIHLKIKKNYFALEFKSKIRYHKMIN